MKASKQGEESIGARSHGLQKIRGREGAATKSRLRLRAAVVAAAVAVLFILGTGAAQFAQAQVESVLHSFTGSDGNLPWAGLIQDSSGNLYGTTNEGGSSTNCGSAGCGIVFELSPPATSAGIWSYTEKVIYNFSGTDGAFPYAGLVMDSKGNLYGTTSQGGSTYSSSTTPGFGTVFELSPPATSGGSWTEKVLHSFTNTDGSAPWAGLIMDSVGNLYGTTNIGASGYGAVFELSPPATSGGNWTEKVLHSFTGTDGSGPLAGLIMDSAGNLYGTTGYGGSTYTSSSSPGYGTVFELSPPATSGGSWTEKVLYNFTGTDGSAPLAGLIMDSSGNLYGTTIYGGSTYSSSTSAGFGTVFELSPPATSGGNWTEKVLYNFTGTDGADPEAALIMDSAGNLYSTTLYGGGGSSGKGTVFELSPPATSGGNWTEKFLYSFTGTSGWEPAAGLIMDSLGNLYGTTMYGGSTYTSSPPADGTVFGIAPITLSATSLSFGSVGVDTSAAQTETVTNIGGGNFSYTSASVSGANAADFSVTNGCSTEVAPGGTCPVSVTFTPSTATAETATLSLSQGGMTQTISLTGTGAYAMVGVAPGMGFSLQPVGTTSSPQTLTVTNTSSVTLNITSVGINGDFAIASNTCTASVAANGGTCSVGVTFTPTATGKRTGTLTLYDNTSTGSQSVGLGGTGEDFSLTARTTSETVSPGGATTFDLLLSPEGGFNQAINLACSGAPQGTTCTVNPTSVTLDGTNSASVPVKVTTTGNAMVGPGPGNFVPPSGSLPIAAWLALLALLALLAVAKFSPKQGRVRRLAPFAALALLITFCVACGGGSSSMSTNNSNTTPAGTYTLQVTGTSGSLSHSASVTLKVQ